MVRTTGRHQQRARVSHYLTRYETAGVADFRRAFSRSSPRPQSRNLREVRAAGLNEVQDEMGEAVGHRRAARAAEQALIRAAAGTIERAAGTAACEGRRALSTRARRQSSCVNRAADVGQ